MKADAINIVIMQRFNITRQENIWEQNATVINPNINEKILLYSMLTLLSKQHLE